MADICKHVLFTGRVQGVGFRYTTARVAREFAVTGFVRNLPSGQVELVAQGSDDVVGNFILAVCKAMNGYIEEHAVSDHPGENLSSFIIRT